jgi:DNA-binding response OmpR family regulator
MESEARILWVEGKRAVSPYFIPGLRKKGFEIETVTTGGEALSRLPDKGLNLVVVNAASMRTSGTRICHSIHNHSGGLPIVLITDRDMPSAGETDAEVILKLPFTIRKLINRINPFMPGDEKNSINAGPIYLYLDKKRVNCEGREASLTPRLVHLLRIFIQNPNQVLERKELFREVWDTEYTEDTRTLDVHISWLRKAIEENPRDPQYIITVRGEGYSLEV